MKSQKSSPESLYDCMITESPKYKIISKMNIADDSIKENLPALTHNLSQVIVSKLSYWNKVKDKAILHPKYKKLMDRVYKEVSEKGLNKVLKKQYLKKLYDEYTN